MPELIHRDGSGLALVVLPPEDAAMPGGVDGFCFETGGTPSRPYQPDEVKDRWHDFG
jgi:hypothetical protein